MKVLLTGTSGQIRLALTVLVPDGIALLTSTREELDMTITLSVRGPLERKKPALVFSCAACTAVDAAGTDIEAAFAGNATAAAALAEGQRSHAGRMIRVSMDFVFDGLSGRPYSSSDAPRPLGVYGRSKLAGEHAVLGQVGSCAAVVRFAWGCGAQGRSFVRSMLDVMDRHGKVREVADQVGTPTRATSLAGPQWALAELEQVGGVHHWTEAGVASWRNFMVAIAVGGCAAGLLQSPPEGTPIGTEEYSTAGRRPLYSILDRRATEQAFGISVAHWRVNRRRMLDELDYA